MSTTWLDSSEQEYEDYGEAEGGEDYGEADTGEDYGEESRAERRRRARIALAARRREAARARARAAGPTRPGPAPIQQRTAAAIRNLDLETKVAEDSLRSTTSAQSKRMTRAEYSAVAAVAVDQIFDSFGGPENAFLRAGLRFAPLLLLAPKPRGNGLEKFITDPRVLGGAAVAGIAFFGEHQKRSFQVSQVSVQSPGTLTAGEKDVFIADIRDRAGSRLKLPVSWSSDDANVATIGADGVVIARGPGVARITLSVDNDSYDYRLRVDPPSSWTGQGAAAQAQAAPATQSPPAPAVQEDSTQGKKR